jgi:hypothetical protein
MRSLMSFLRPALTVGAAAITVLVLYVPAAQAQWRGRWGWHPGWGWHHHGAWRCCWRGVPPVFVVPRPYYPPPPVYYAPPPAYYVPPPVYYGY